MNKTLWDSPEYGFKFVLQFLTGLSKLGADNESIELRDTLIELNRER